MSSLSGKRIAITRPRNQQAPFAKLIAKAGGIVLTCPLIAISPCYDAVALRKLLSRVGEFDWICFTSANGVNLVFEFVAKQDDLFGCFEHARFACIGPATAKALKVWGKKTHVVPEAYQAEGLLDAFNQDDVKGKSFLLLRAKGARPILHEALSSGGAQVVELPVYEAVPDNDGIENLGRALLSRQVDCVSFTSSSTVHAFVNVLKKNNLHIKRGDVILASIGPITSGTLLEESLWVDVEAKVFTTEGLLEALEEFFRKEGVVR